MPIWKKSSPGLNVFSSFKHTDHSERLRNTFTEVQQFKRQLLKAEAAIRLYAKATDEVLKTTDESLEAFPRVWRKADHAANAATLPDDDVAKPAPSVKGKLANHPSGRFHANLDASLHEEVYTPIDRWHKQYKVIKTRIAAVESTRIEYDSARKDLAAAREAQLKHARKTDGKTDTTLDNNEAQAERILANKREAYLAIEEEVHTELLAVAADAQQALGYVSRALHLEARTLMDAADQLAEKEASMPQIDRQSSGPLELGTGASIAGSPIGSPAGTPKSASPTGYGASSFRTANYAPDSPVGTTGQLHPATPTEQAAAGSTGFKTPPSNLSDQNRAGRFDEEAAFKAQQQGVTEGTGKLSLGDSTSAPLGSAPLGSAAAAPPVPQKTAATADVSGTTAGNATVGTGALPSTGTGMTFEKIDAMRAADQFSHPSAAQEAPAAPTHKIAPPAGRVQDSATEFPSAPTHAIGNKNTNDLEGTKFGPASTDVSFGEKRAAFLEEHAA